MRWHGRSTTLPKKVFYLRKDQWYIVGFKYDAALVKAMKVAIPGRMRTWSPATKHWAIAETYWDVFCRLVEERGYEVESALD